MTTPEELNPNVTIRLIVKAGDQGHEQETRGPDSGATTQNRSSSDPGQTPEAAQGQAGGAGLRDGQKAGHTSAQSRPHRAGIRPGASEIGPLVTPATAPPDLQGNQRHGPHGGFPVETGDSPTTGAFQNTEPGFPGRARPATRPRIDQVEIIDDMADVAACASPLYRQLYAQVMSDFHAGRLMASDSRPVLEISDAKAMAAFRADQLTRRLQERRGR